MPIYNPIYLHSPSDNSSNFIEKIAAVTIAQFQAVIVDESVELASNEIETHASKRIGIAVSSAGVGELVKIQTFGLIVNNGWNWQQQKPILLGVDGSLIQGLAASGFVLVLGFPEEANSMFLDAQTPLMRN